MQTLLLFIYSECFFFFKQKTAYEMRISDWSSDVCSSDLVIVHVGGLEGVTALEGRNDRAGDPGPARVAGRRRQPLPVGDALRGREQHVDDAVAVHVGGQRLELVGRLSDDVPAPAAGARPRPPPRVFHPGTPAPPTNTPTP